VRIVFYMQIKLMAYRLSYALTKKHLSIFFFPFFFKLTGNTNANYHIGNLQQSRENFMLINHQINYTHP